MNLNIPDGANVHIFIGAAPPLAILDAGAPAPTPPMAARRPFRIGRNLFKSVVGLALLVGAFSLGQRSISAGSRMQLASNASTAAPSLTPAPAEQPGVPGQLAQAGDSHVPAAFQQQLQQAPTIVPAPGAATRPDGESHNPFGLEN